MCTYSQYEEKLQTGQHIIYTLVQSYILPVRLAAHTLTHTHN